MIRKMLFASLFVLATAPANACSLCIAHALGAALHGIGAQTLHSHETVLAISYLQFDKSNGTDMPGITEKEKFNQTSIDFSTGITHRLMITGSIPFVNKSVTAVGSPKETNHGLADISLGAAYQLPPSPGGKFLTAFSLDVKLPTGSNNAVDGSGALRDQHIQLGTGSVDFVAGATVTMEGSKPGDIWFAGLKGRRNGSNDRGYHYGDVYFYNLGLLRPVGHGAAAVIEFNGRIADKDTMEDGTKDPNTGGLVGYLSLTYRKNLGSSMGLIATLQEPVLTKLYGYQKEGAYYGLTLTRVF